MKNIFVILLFIACLSSAEAQVTIGSTKLPEKYSLLEIDSEDGGVMLPHISSTEMDTWAADPTFTGNVKSKGLMAYNPDTKSIVYWDGLAWRFVNSMLNVAAENGVTYTPITSTLKLGGNLTENTELVFGSNALTFDLGTQGSTLSVNSDVQIKEEDVKVIPTGGITINDIHSIKQEQATFKVDELNISASGAAKPNVLLDGDGLTFTELALNIPGVASSNMLTIDPTTQQVEWQPIRPFSSVLSGTIYPNVSVSGSNTTVSSSIKLPKGQYLVFASVNMIQVATSAYMYNWIGLKIVTTDNAGVKTTESRRLNGVMPEDKKTTEGYSYSTPSFKYYLNIDKEAEISVFVVSSNSSNNKTNVIYDGSMAGPSYFKAVRIDLPDYDSL